MGWRRFALVVGVSLGLVLMHGAGTAMAHECETGHDVGSSHQHESAPDHVHESAPDHVHETTADPSLASAPAQQHCLLGHDATTCVAKIQKAISIPADHSMALPATQFLLPGPLASTQGAAHRFDDVWPPPAPQLIEMCISRT